MVISRKRKRALSAADSSHDFPAGDPPPFAPAHLSMLKAHRAPLSRSLTAGLSPLILNLVLIAGHRLQRRDYVSAAAVLPVLLKRYRRTRASRWSFPREIVHTGVAVLSRLPAQGTLDEFLSHVIADAQLSATSSCEAYSGHTRESVLLQKVIDLLARGALHDAFDALVDHSHEPSFRDCPLIQGYLGVVALAASVRDPDPGVKLRIAAAALKSAAALDPSAYFYVYYAAAVEVAADRPHNALTLLRDFCEARASNDDPLALHGLLSCLSDSPQDRQERVLIARRLLRADPISTPAADILREAHSWKWDVRPPVDSLELAQLFATKIEHGGEADMTSWRMLGESLAPSQQHRRLFWQNRSHWWPSHFFRVTRLNVDLAANPKLVAVKAAVANMLTAPHQCPYAEQALASGAVQPHEFNALQS